MPASLALLVATSASPVPGQSPADLLGAIRQGGGWVAIPVTGGEGSIESATVPTVGLRLAGCFQVWKGHSGRWEIRAHELETDKRLDVTAAPGEPVRFDHQTTLSSRLHVDVAWSEPRDTTLVLWVGLEGAAARDPCEPVYPGG